ncbi:MAG: TadE/TadG family type IV pilus assembly protein [Humibacter sp.]
MLAWRDDRGSAPAEFVLVGALLTVLTLAVLQFGLALLVRNTLVDAAAEGAHVAALADNTLGDGRDRTRQLIGTALGDDYARDVSASYERFQGMSAVTVTVRAPLPLLGLLGLDHGVEVSGHAPVEVAG